MTSCPLYRSAQDASPWIQANGAHRGLIFDKFGNAWRNTGQGVLGWEFNRPAGQEQPRWLLNFAETVPGDRNQLTEACQRQRALIEAQGGVVVILKNTTRFVTGLGRQHPVENGFAWHHTLGTPYLPGSSLKGVLRAWMRDNEDKREEEWFGSQEAGIGRVTLLDMLPCDRPKLVVDVMTPHYSPYYQDGDIPGDWHGPNPIQFLTVEQGVSWQAGAILRAPRQDDHETVDTNELKQLLTDALEWGAGAKTAVGYGAFEQDDAKTRHLESEAEKARAEREHRKRLDAELATLTPHAALLTRLADEQNWGQEDATALLKGLEHFKDEVPKPDADSIRLIKEWLDGRYPGIWEDPERVQGKKNRRAYNERAANLVNYFSEFEKKP